MIQVRKMTRNCRVDGKQKWQLKRQRFGKRKKVLVYITTLL